MKTFYKHYWIEAPGKPNVIVATLYDEETGKIGRGMSIKSPQDPYDVLTGEKIATNYALRAIKKRSDKLVTDPRAIGILIKTGCPWTKHSDRNPELTFEEQRRLFGPNFRKKEPCAKVYRITIYNNTFNSGHIASGHVAISTPA
jgi:hypothetical protein